MTNSFFFANFSLIFEKWLWPRALENPFNAKYKVFSQSVAHFGLSQTQILIYTDQRGSHSLTSVKRKGDPPVCTTSQAFQCWKWRQLAQTSFSGSKKASSKADRGMTVLITLLILREKNSFSFWMAIKTKKLILYQNIVLPVQNLGGASPPAWR